MDISADRASRVHFWREDARVQAVVQTVADGVVGIDAAGGIELFNPAAEQLFGYTSSEVIGCNVSKLMPAEYGKHHDRHLSKYVETGERHIIGIGREVAGRRKDGSTFPMYLSVGELSLPGFRGFLGIVHDLTAQKQAERSLAETGDLLQAMLSSMPSVLVGVDASGRVTHWNQAASTETGFTQDQALGRTFADLFPGLQLHHAEIGRAVETGTRLHKQKLPLPAGGGSRYLDLMIYPLCYPANGAVIRMDDVTERVRIEEIMVQTEKMMSVGGLAAGMAHEINNPLGAIAQGCQNIDRRLSPDLTANVGIAQELDLDMQRLQTYLERRGIHRIIGGVREAAERASCIVNDMLAYSRRSASSFVPVHLNRLIDTTLRLAGHDYDLRKGYDFRRIRIVRGGLGTNDMVLCDEMAVEQVLLNLLRNASQAMMDEHSDGAPTIRLEVHDQGGWVRLEVTDNGPGMTEDIAKHLFEPFFTTKPVGVGTGLGLSVAYFIVTEQHRGTISVDTAPGKGARFIIRLPREGKPYASIGTDR